MNNSTTLSLCILSLVVVALIMIGFGASAGILPPVLTGIGFIVIAIALEVVRKSIRQNH